MSDESYTFRTPPDERGNVIHIDSPQPIGPRVVRECVEWYWAEPHHHSNSEPEHDRHIWITTVEVGFHSSREWKYLSAKDISDDLWSLGDS